MMRNRTASGAPRRVIAVCAGGLVLYLAVLSGQRALDGYRARQQVVAAVQEIENLRQQNMELQFELQQTLQPSEIETMARTELGFVRPGDHPIVMLWPEGKPPTESPRATTSTAGAPRWRSWLRLFADLD